MDISRSGGALLCGRVGLCAVVVCLPWASSVRADRDIAADLYLDKLRGMWMGQVLGNYAGKGAFDDGGTSRKREGAVTRGGWDYDIGWDSFLGSDPWVGDDDTSLEYLYMHTLTGNPAPSDVELGQTWADHVITECFCIANRQAGWLIAEGAVPPEGGSLRRNMNWYAIDSQIATEAIGAASPGLRQRGADLVGQFGAITNDGYAVHAARYYGAMYAAAAFETDVEACIDRGLAVVPQTSRTHQVVQDVIDWYTADAADQTLDWRATHGLLYDKYGCYAESSHYRYRNWIESTVNCGLTTLALLYGQGEFVPTVEIAVLGGYDADCNPATAAGLLGLLVGYSGLPAELTGGASDNYHVGSGLDDVPLDSTITEIAQGWQAVAEQQILLAGGTITGSGADRTYRLPDDDPVTPPPERPDPSGPGGLVGRVIDAGGSVTVSASVETHLPLNDRKNLEAIIDGITDVSYNGHLPYWTYDGGNTQPPGGDFYQLNFSEEATFVALTFHEGDIGWNGINANPRLVEPMGGYFLNLTVEVGDGQTFTEVGNLQLSEPLDPHTYFQEIRLAFEPATGTAIRIRGDAGGTCEFTSIVELTAAGFLGAPIPGDANADLVVDIQDLTALAGNWNERGWVNWVDGEFTGNGVIDIEDLTALAGNWTFPPAGQAVPEPHSVALLTIVAAAQVGRKARRR